MRLPAGETTSSRALIESVISDAKELVGLEIALARQELKDLAVRNGIAVGFLVLGAILIALAVLVSLPVLVVVLVPWHWQAAAAWLALYLLGGLVLVLVGRARLRLQPPARTIESLKESKEWALRHVRSNGR